MGRGMTFIRSFWLDSRYHPIWEQGGVLLAGYLSLSILAHNMTKLAELLKKPKKKRRKKRAARDKSFAGEKLGA